MIAAKIIMLRMTPLSIADSPDFTTVASKLRPAANRASGNFGEKDERRVNEFIAGAKAETIRAAGFLHVPRGLTRRVGMALAGSSGQG